MNKIQASSSTELSVLRVNCIEDTPSPIENIFTLSSINLLVLCRSDNTIELWNSEHWIQLLKIPGMKSNQTRRVFLVLKKNSSSSPLLDQIRLFTTGLNGYLIEWDLIKLKPKYSYKNPGGCIWDVAIQGKLCLLGTNDGSARVVKLKNNTDPFLVNQFPKTDSRILSVCWEEDNADIIYTGHSNGTIMKWSYITHQVLLTFNVNSSDSLIWSLCSVNSKHLICGDSQGRLMIFDASFGILVKDFKEHTADIMGIVKNSSKESPCVYYSGIDSLVCSVQYDSYSNDWILTSSFRGQSHDINTLAMINDECLLSGGITTDVCIYHIIKGCLYQKYDKKINTGVKRHISPFEHKAKYSIAYVNAKNVLILHRKLTSCDLWLVSPTESVFLSKISKKSSNEFNILSSNVDSKGEYIAMSYDDKTIVYNYTMNTNEIKKMYTLPFLSNFIFFKPSFEEPTKSTSKSKTQAQSQPMIICLCQSNGLVYICTGKDIAKSIKIKKHQSILSCQYNPNTNTIAYSTLSKDVYTINLTTGDITAIPHPNTYITQLKFLINNQLLTISAQNQLYIITLSTNKFTDWTNQRIERNDYPSNYLTWYNKVFGCASVNDTSLLLYTDYNYIKVDLTKELPKECIIEKQKMEKYLNSDWDKQVREYHQSIFDLEYKTSKNKQMMEMEVFGKDSANERKQSSKLMNDNFKIVSRYNAIMLMEMLPNNQMIVIENDWNRIIKTFPGGVIKKNYGQ